MEFNGKHVLVLGLGESGLAMARWLTRQGACVRVADSRRSPPAANQAILDKLAVPVISGEFTDALLVDIALVALSPGVSIKTPLVQAALAKGLLLVSEIDLFADGLRAYAPKAKMLAITGSNGKTTTTALTAHLLNSAGIDAVACGNISPSALDALMAAMDAPNTKFPEVWVLELSSFQLESTSALRVNAATLLNISEDHLDRHDGLEDYAAIKGQLLESAAVRVINRDDPFSLAYQCKNMISFGGLKPTRATDYGVDLDSGWICRGQEKLIALDSLKIVGTHNAANAMAALALCEAIGIEPSRLLAGLASFTGLPHRVEFVAKVDGVSFFDDSKATNVGATLAALQGLGCKVALILGGEGKAQDFSPLSNALGSYAHAVALIGRDTEIIFDAINECGVPIKPCANLEEAVLWCKNQSHAGEAVLLSPACASFDMFKSYVHRAEVFIRIVNELIEKSKKKEEVRAVLL